MQTPRTAGRIFVDFNSFSSCCDTFSRLLWPSDTASLLLSHIQHIAVSPPAQFLSADILPFLVRLSQLCESSLSAFNLAHAAELVVLALSNSLEMAHHKMFLFGFASVMQLRLAEGPNRSSSDGIFRERQLQEYMGVISEVLLALNFAPLQFRAQIDINDASQHDCIFDAIHSIRSESARLLSNVPIDFLYELTFNFRQQIQIALSGIGVSAPLILSFYNRNSPLESEKESIYPEREEPNAAIEVHTLMRDEALSVHQPSSANDEVPDSLVFSISTVDFRTISSALLGKIVAQVASRFTSTPSGIVETGRRIIELACSRLLQSVVFEVSKRFQSSVPVPAAVVGEIELSKDIAAVGGTHGFISSELNPSQETGDEQPLLVDTSAIYGRHPSYRTPVPHVEVISFEQVNPVWTHQCKPGSRICVLLRCQQRSLTAGGSN